MFMSEPFLILGDRSWDHTTVCSKPPMSSLSVAPPEDLVLHRMPGPLSYEGFGERSQDALTFGHKQQAKSCRQVKDWSHLVPLFPKKHWKKEEKWENNTIIKSFGIWDPIRAAAFSQSVNFLSILFQDRQIEEKGFVQNSEIQRPFSSGKAVLWPFICKAVGPCA